MQPCQCHLHVSQMQRRRSLDHLEHLLSQIQIEETICKIQNMKYKVRIQKIRNTKYYIQNEKSCVDHLSSCAQVLCSFCLSRSLQLPFNHCHNAFQFSSKDCHKYCKFLFQNIALETPYFEEKKGLQ